MVGQVAASALLLLASSVSASPSLSKRAALDTFIASERITAVKGVLANIGPNGALATNASRGVVIAGPGIVNPDYRYSWTRDSALTLAAISEEFFVGNASLQTTIEDYIYAEANRQTVDNPMGPLIPWGTGLGEAKFQINLTRYNFVWGRPQRDGPALRANTLMVYINWLISNGKYSEAKNVVWPVVINDLNYVAEYWNETGYDLWEEVAGSSFFTIQSQYRALVQGSQIAARLGESCPNCASQAPQIGCFLENSFWNASAGHVIANINGGGGRSGVDANYLLGAIENFDIDGSCADNKYQPCSSRILSSLKVYVDSFRSIYPINAGVSADAAVATGRYPEDTYYGGNPWYLCTLSVAETLYDAAAQFRRQGQLTIDAVNLAFFKQIYPAAATGTYLAPRNFRPGGSRFSNWGWSSCGTQTWGSPSWMSSGGRGSPSSNFSEILTAMTTYADGFVSVVEKYTPSNGSYSEQYNRTTGEQLSAYDLTWSFASFVTMAQRRAGQYPASWNSRAASAIPNTCANSSAIGTYAPATAAGAPTLSTACTVQVTFNVNASTTFGQNVYMTGNASAIGDWAPNYEPMVPVNYPIWYSIVDLAPSTTYAYKYVHQNAASYAFETLNRTITTPACRDGRVQIATHDAFTTEGTVVSENFCNGDVTRCW